MKLFADNSVVARSRFWYYMSLMKKVKRANGEIVSVKEIFEKNANSIKNYGMWLRYDSRSGTHNMYKEYRDLTLTGAVAQMYEELAGRHRARKSCIQIVRTATIAAKDCRRIAVTQFHDSEIKFKLNHRLSRPSSKVYRKTFKAQAPGSFF
jgi:large subunit ribosomal protein L18Ae